MNIAFAANRLTKYDAASNYSVAVVEKLSRKNKVDLYAFSIEREISQDVKPYNYTRKNAHNLWSVLSAILKIHSLSKRFSKYDMVVVASPDVTILPIIHLAKLFNPHIKLVWDFHGLTPPQFFDSYREKFLMWIRQIAFFWSMKRSDYIKVDSDHIKKEVESKIDRRDIKTLYIGINTDRFKNINIKNIKEILRLEGRFVMIYVGRLAASKMIDFLIKAMQDLDGTVLLVAGDGEERESLKNLAHSLNLEDEVIFIGRVSDYDLPKYYSVSDVFVTASLHEGFCVPIIESFASGKPVIVPDRAAMPEIAGEAGLVYEPGSINDFVSKVQMLKNDSNLREQLSRKASDRSGKFDLEKSVKTYEEFLENLNRS